MVGQAAPESSGEKMLMLAVNGKGEKMADDSDKDFFPTLHLHIKWNKHEDRAQIRVNKNDQHATSCIYVQAS